MLASTSFAQTGATPPGDPPPVAGRFAPHPYKSALAALANYGSCGVNANAAKLSALAAALRGLETGAEARGLGPTLERLRQEYFDLLAVSSIAACTRGAVAALADARRAIDAFRAWVADQPAM